jgi:hypothetical protein
VPEPVPECTIAAPIGGISANALKLTGLFDGHKNETSRRAGLARANQWLARLPSAQSSIPEQLEHPYAGTFTAEGACVSARPW